MNNIKNILITGSNGFIGSNLKFHLLENHYNVLEYKSNHSLKKLKNLIKKSDFVFHLGGINKSKKIKDFIKNNVILTKNICQFILENKKTIPIFFSSSTQVNVKADSIYSKTKKEAEKILIKNSKKIQVILARLPNVYGKWSRPNYNSAVATFCHNILRNKKITIHNKNEYVNLYYIDDLLKKLYKLISSKDNKIYPKINKIDKIKVRNIVHKILNFYKNITNIHLDDLKSRINKNLYSTFISFIPKKFFSFKAQINKDNRGNFVEFLKSKNFGQVSFFSINLKKSRGDHYHHSKVEQFMILRGSAKIKYFNLYDNKTIIKKVSDKKMEIFRSMPGYVHTIINTGRSQILGIVWANENFNIKNADTYKLDKS